MNEPDGLPFTRIGNRIRSTFRPPENGFLAGCGTLPRAASANPSPPKAQNAAQIRTAPALFRRLAAFTLLDTL